MAPETSGRTAVVLFSGMGGATEGLLRAGLDVQVAIDGWDKACVAHRRWRSEVPVIRARCEALPLNGCAPWLLWASPSCKPYSMANRTPKRGKVHPEYYSTALLVRQAVEMGARWLVMENVGGLLWSQEGKVELAEMRAECARQGLRWLASIVNSNTCGIAQIRRRLFVVVGPEYVHIPHGSDYIPPENAETPMMACEGSKGSLEREMRWPKASAAVDASPASRHANWTGATPDRARNGSVVSVRASEHLGGRRTDRATQGRTLAECAALQQVPLEPLAGMSKRVAHELCGNAVPPPLAEHVARSLIKHEQQEMLVPAWGR